MGINARNSDAPTPLMVRLTLSREAREEEMRARVRRGEMSLETYLTDVKGYRPEHIAPLLPQFRKAIFG